MKADTLHNDLINLLTGYCHSSGYLVKENDKTFSYVEKTLLNANTKTRKVLLHWLKGYKDRLTTDNKSLREFRHYVLHPKATFDQMLDHLDHLNYIQKIKAPVNYDPLSYRTHYDCLHIVTEYPLPTKPIDPSKFHYLNKVAKMFDDDDNCYTVYRFDNHKKTPAYDSPKEAFITLMRSHFGKHAMPWCICTDSPRNFWDSPDYDRKYVVFKNNKLYAAAASGYGSCLTLFDRTNKEIGTLFLPTAYPEHTDYILRFSNTFQEDELTFVSAIASAFNRPVIPGCVHQDKPIETLPGIPFRCLSSKSKGLQWYTSKLVKASTKQDLPSYSGFFCGVYTLPSSNRLYYKVKLTVDNDKNIPLHVITDLEVYEADETDETRITITSHKYCYQMTKENAASLIEQHVKESLARTSKKSTKEPNHE